MIRCAASRYLAISRSNLRRQAKHTSDVHPSLCIVRFFSCSQTSSGMNLNSLPATSINQLHSISIAKDIHSFSTVAMSSTNTSTNSDASFSSSSKNNDSSQKDNDKSKDSKKKKDDSNIFLDNLGKIFLSTIGIVLFMLLRSTTSNNSRTSLREDIEATSLLDPLEIEDLRLANADFTIDVWYKIVKEIKNQFPGKDSISYPEFLSVVMKVMREVKGEGFTIQFGHLVDRVVVAELERVDKEDVSSDGVNQRKDLMQNELPLSFLYAALSLALHSSVTDRIQALYDTMLDETNNNYMTSSSTNTTDEEESSTTTVSGDKLIQMIQHLQNTCQLVPEAQIVETNSKVPYQTYRVGTGDELVKRAREGYGGKKGSTGVTAESDGPITLEDFHAILKSRTICAWGECYVKKSSRTATSDR